MEQSVRGVADGLRKITRGQLTQSLVDTCKDLGLYSEYDEDQCGDWSREGK